MRIAAWTIFSSLLVAAASAQLSAGHDASSSSVLLESRNIASTTGSALQLEPRDEEVEIDVEEEEEEDVEGDAIEARGRRKPHHRNHKHSRAGRKKNKHKAHHAVPSPAAGKGKFHGKGTFFKPNQGSCGKWNTVNDHVVALSSDIYQGGSHCFKSVNICHGSKCANAYVADLCPGCKKTSLDMTPSLFKELADPNLGVIDIQWSFTS